MEDNIFLISDKDYNNFTKTAFIVFVEEIRKILQKQEKVFIGLSGGKSLLDFYSLFSLEPSIFKKNEFKKLFFLFLDERIVEKNSKELNYNLLKNLFLNDLIKKKLISKSQIINFNISLDDKKIITDATKKIKKIDIALFGAGEDNHIASIFKNSISLKSKNSFFIEYNSPKSPKKRISVTPKIIKNSICFIFFISSKKKKAYGDFFSNKKTINECPSKIILNSKKIFVITNIN